MRTTDEIAVIEAFLAVVDHGSFHKAAKFLNISKPAVMRRIDALEARVGNKLLIRSEAGCTPTATGRVFEERAREVSADFLQANQAQRQMKDVREVLHISVPYSLGTSLIIGWTGEFQELFPGVAVDLNMTLGPVRLLPTECDIRFSHGLMLSERVLIDPLGGMPRVMVASPAFLQTNGIPLTPQDLEQLDLVGGQDLIEESSFLLSRGDEYVRVGFHPRLRLRDHTAAKVAAVEGLGIDVHAFAHDVVKEIERGELVQVLSDWQPTACPISMLYPTSHELKKTAKDYADFIKDKWRQHPVLLDPQ